MPLQIMAKRWEIAQNFVLTGIGKSLVAIGGLSIGSPLTPYHVVHTVITMNQNSHWIRIRPLFPAGKFVGRSGVLGPIICGFSCLCNRRPRVF